MKPLKLVSIFLIILVIANIALFAFGKITTSLFWFVIVFCAVMAYIVIPYTRKKLSSF